jgi:hypothetical protein
MGPISTFSAKIKAAYAFGMIGPNTRDDLEIVRKAFAYGTAPLDFPIEGSKEDIRSFTPQEPRHWNNAKLSSRLALEPRYELRSDHRAFKRRSDRVIAGSA